MVDVFHSQGVIDDNAKIGKRLERLRVALGWPNQAEFCRKLGIAANRWNQYENGSRRITLDVVNKLRLKFGVTADYIYFGDESGLPTRITAAFQDAAE